MEIEMRTVDCKRLKKKFHRLNYSMKLTHRSRFDLNFVPIAVKAK